MQARDVQPEILDSLSPDDPRAKANRRDLRFLNAVMGNHRWIAGELRRRRPVGGAIVEAGAGEGDLGRFLRRRGVVGPETDYRGLDRLGRPGGWPPEWGWAREDLRNYRPGPGTAAFVANLLLHQFGDEELRDLGRRLSAVPLWIVCEPLRVRWSVWGLALLRPFGLSPVSWHDGRVSVRAGFRRHELAGLLGAGRDGRRFRVREDPRGSYRLVSWLAK